MYIFYTHLIVGVRFLVPKLNLGEIPFSCKVNYELPENVKIACKARLISCTLWFSTYALLPICILVLLLKMLPGVTGRIINNLQKNLFVL